MNCVQNRIYCHDCNRFYKDGIYSNHLRSQGHINNVMEKRCCSCNVDTTRNELCCNKCDLAGCISKLSLKSDVTTQTDFSDKQDGSRKRDHTTKQTNNYKNIDPNLLCNKLRQNLGKLDRSESDNIMVKMIIDELLRTGCITRKQYKVMCGRIGLV